MQMQVLEAEEALCQQSAKAQQILISLSALMLTVCVSLASAQAFRQNLMLDLKIEREDARRIGLEVAQRSQRAAMLGAKHSTLCLKKAAQGGEGDVSQVPFHPSYIVDIILYHASRFPMQRMHAVGKKRQSSQDVCIAGGNRDQGS